MTTRSLEIVCTSCGEETLVRRKATYDGFQKTGEVFVCVSCGFEYPSEAEVPYKARKTLAIFGEADKAKTIEVFDDDEKRINCRYCRHYVVNPFIQRCGLHHREIVATDLCDDFDRAPKDESV